MICPNCQATNRDGSRFCVSCGYTMPVVPAPPAWATAAPAPPTAQPPAYVPSPPAYVPAAPLPASDIQAVAAPAAVSQARPVVVTDINMPFGSMVVFMVKWALASIPAVIILAVVFLILSGILGGVLAGLLGALLG